MNRYINITLISLIIGFGAFPAQSKTIGIDLKNAQISNPSKDYGSPIKRWAGDAKCKLKRFFGGNCYT